MIPEPEFIEYRVVPERSRVAFSVRHLMISKVKGCFERFSGFLRLAPDNVARSEIQGTIEVASITTSDPARDEYLRTHEFFDPKRFPEMKFTSTGIHAGSHDGMRITGLLRIKEVSAPVELEVEGLGTVRDTLEIRARGKLDRREFGLVWPPAIEAGGVLVGNEVEIDLKIHVVKV
jgi:polyisoprenoid-binding protein YceI